MSIATIYFADSGLFRLKPCYWNLGLKDFLKEYTDPLHTTHPVQWWEMTKDTEMWKFLH